LNLTAHDMKFLDFVDGFVFK